MLTLKKRPARQEPSQSPAKPPAPEAMPAPGPAQEQASVPARFGLPQAQ